MKKMKNLASPRTIAELMKVAIADLKPSTIRCVEGLSDIRIGDIDNYNTEDSDVCCFECSGLLGKDQSLGKNCIFVYTSNPDYHADDPYSDEFIYFCSECINSKLKMMLAATIVDIYEADDIRASEV
jgi:hypothetical protein